MTSFIRFLQSECSAIQTYLESGLSVDEETRIDVDKNVASHISRYPQLQTYFEVEGANDLISWSQGIRVAIVDHLITFEIDIVWLMDIVVTYRMEVEMEELVEIVRAMDILGAEKRLLEYETILYVKFKKSGKAYKEWEEICGDRLPANFYDHIEKFFSASPSRNVGTVGSERLIEYFIVSNNTTLDKNEIFLGLCSTGHLSAAQWFHRYFDVINIHAVYDIAFQQASYGGHLVVVQWLYSLGEVNINADHYAAFRLACTEGHLSVAQWIYSLGGVDIHGQNENIFRFTCIHGHLLVAQWLYSLFDVNIHAENDWVFEYACINGHLAVAQWLYSLGRIKTRVLQHCMKISYDTQLKSWLTSVLTDSISI
jgi:hypothetical protein